MAGLVVTAGYASLDRIARVSALPAPGTTAVVQTGDDELHWGGCAFNIAVGLARLGTPAAVIGWLGGDDGGRRYLLWLRQNRVDTRGVAVRRGSTARSSLYYDGEGSSVCFYWPGQTEGPEDAEKAGAPAAARLLDEAAWLLLTVAPAELTSQLLEESARRSLPVIWSVKADATVYPEPLVRRLLAQARILFLNEHEKDFLLHFVREADLFKTGPELIVLTRGKEGGTVYQRGIPSHFKAAEAREMVDGTGVGDAFISGFLWKHLEGGSLREACTAGAVNAAAVVEKVGSQTGLCTGEELQLRQQGGGRG